MTTDDFESKDVFLRKNGHILGFHAIGHTIEGGQFLQLEIWGNEYDENYNMLGPGSFRVFGTIEAITKEMVDDGWEVFERPKS